jgi:hypothetical protein
VLPCAPEIDTTTTPMADPMARHTAVALVLLAAFAAACGTPCSDLDAQCADCAGTDPASVAVEARCKLLVDHDDYDTCDLALDSELYTCP